MVLKIDAEGTRTGRGVVKSVEWLPLVLAAAKVAATFSGEDGLQHLLFASASLVTTPPKYPQALSILYLLLLNCSSSLLFLPCCFSFPLRPSRPAPLCPPRRRRCRREEIITEAEAVPFRFQEAVWSASTFAFSSLSLSLSLSLAHSRELPPTRFTSTEFTCC